MSDPLTLSDEEGNMSRITLLSGHLFTHCRKIWIFSYSLAIPQIILLKRKHRVSFLNSFL